jgi:hypothetical protein
VLAHQLLKQRSMKAAFPLLSGLLILVLASGESCNDGCEGTCQSDHDDCVSSAHGDDARVARCDADRDQCVGSCASEPIDKDR